MPFISSYDSRRGLSSLGSGSASYSRTYTSSPMSSLTRKTSWERPSSLYSNGTTPDSSSGAKYGASSGPSWRTSLASSDSASSLPKYSSRPVSTASTESGPVSQSASARYENGGSRFEAGGGRASWRDAFNKETDTPSSTSTTTKYGSWRDNSETPANRYSSLKNDSSTSKYSSHNNDSNTSKYSSHKNDSNTPKYSSLNNDSNTSKYSSHNNDSNTSKYSSLNNDSNTPKYSSHNNDSSTSKYSSLNRDKDDGSSKYSFASNTNGGSDNKYSHSNGKSRFEDESSGTSKYSFESILAKYKTTNGADTNPGSSQSTGVGASSSGSKLFQSNTLPRCDRTETSSSGVDNHHSNPITSSTSASNNSSLYKYTKKESDTKLDHLTVPIVCRTSASSLTVSSPTYSRSNSNTATSESSVTPAYSRQISADSRAGGTNGSSLPFGNSSFASNTDNNLNSLERRSSKKYSGLSNLSSAFERKIEKANDVADKIEQTLAKHKVGPKEETPAWMRPRDPSLNRGAQAESVDRSERSRILQDRGTSPGLDTDQANSSSRIGRSSEIYSIRKTTYFRPETDTMAVQTDQYYLRPRTSDTANTFDLYDHVKKTLPFTTYTPENNVTERLEKHKEKEQVELQNKVVPKTPMAGLLPGYQSRSSRDENGSGYEEILEKALENGADKKVETESEWETDEDVIEAKPEEAKLEDALAKLDMLDLDSDDDARYNNYSNKAAEKAEPAAPVPAVTSYKDDNPSNLSPSSGEPRVPVVTYCEAESNKTYSYQEPDLEPAEEADEAEEEERVEKPTTFISEMMDIDDLLCKPSHFVAFDSPIAFEEEETDDNASKTHSGDFSSAKPLTELVAEEEKPWWSSGDSGQTNTDFSHAKKSSALEETPWWESKEKTEERPAEPAEDKPEPQKDEEAEESEWESEYEEAEEEEEEEEEGEWEYYYDEEEEAEDDDVKSMMDVATQKRAMSETEKDEKKEWIIRGLQQIIPMIPTRQKEAFDEDQTDGEEEDEKEEGDELKIQPMLEPEQKGYKDWLAAAAQDIEEEEELEMMSPLSEDTPSFKEAVEAVEELTEVQKKTRSKANKIHDKLNTTDGAELKKVLFSLKTFFQEDKHLVRDFIKVGGLSRLVELGREDEVQLQNFILRALGQIMLYVDGMQGVMEHIQAIELLYKLIASENKLVVKTAIKLLLVFIEYNESNYIILIDAVKNVGEEQDTIPWCNLIGVMSANDIVDVELCTYALTLVNKTLYEIDDQPIFYDQTDFMEDLGIEKVTALTSEDVPSTLLEEIQLYNVALKQEDGEQVTEEDISALYQDASLRLRTSLRTKVATRSNVVRKSLRQKIIKLNNAEPDTNGDIEGLSYKDLSRILTKNNLPTSPSGDHLNELELSGGLGKARTAFLAKLSRGETETPVPAASPEPDEREGETQWEKIVSSTSRPLVICDIDFTDLQEEETEELTKPAPTSGAPPAPPPPPSAGPVPPPPPPSGGGPPPPPPPGPPAPPLPPAMPLPPKNAIESLNPISNYRKSKKTIKLFWREVMDNNRGEKTVWDEMTPVSVDHKYLEYLFESRGRESIMKENMSKIQVGPLKEIVVLDNKRSNFINIGMTKFPPPRIIKNAVMKMDSSIINKEGIEKLLTMLPSEEEVSKIEEAQEVNPELPLGTAEQFLITLSSITGLEARLRLWAFKIDFEDLEKEICEPMADLKQGLENLHKNPTFKAILNVTLIIGNFLNNSSSKGFQIDYLAKIPEVKDTVHKHSLLYHLTFSVLESLPTASDLYSEIGPITRASRTDFEEVSSTLSRMKEECKNSWDYLRIIARYDDAGETESFRNKTSEFLTDAAERIIIMGKVHKRIQQRFFEFLSWLGIPKHLHNDYRAHQVCKIISEFSLEFRTTRERVQQTIAKKKEAKERNKSRQKLHELMKNYAQSKEGKEVDDLSAMLRVEADGSIPRRKKKHRPRPDGEPRRRRGEGGEGEERRRRHRHREPGEEAGPEHQPPPPEEEEEEHTELEPPVRRRRRPPAETSQTEDPASIEERLQRRRKKLAEDPNITTEEAAALLEKMEKRRRRKEESRAETEAGEAQSERTEDERRAEARERRRRSQKSRSANITEQSVQLADGQRVAESAMDAGLFESLMNTAADLGVGTLRRSKGSRRSTKTRDSSKQSGDLMRSRTRENNVYEEEE